MEDDQLELKRLSAHRSIQWFEENADAIVELNEINKCRNTRQGRDLITDDRGKYSQIITQSYGVINTFDDSGAGCVWVALVGSSGYLCQRGEVLQNGCCDLSGKSKPGRFDCKDCNQLVSCCSTFEHCVSCCLQPRMRSLLEHVIRQVPKRRLRLFLTAQDQFALCMNKCRTSSNSVYEENQYKNSKLKYCFGLEPKLPYDSR